MGSDRPVSDMRDRRDGRDKMHVRCERKLSGIVTTSNMERVTDAVADIADSVSRGLSPYDRQR